MPFVKVKTENLSEEEDNGHTSWLDDMAEELENFESEEGEAFGFVKTELDETTNDSVKSNGRDSRKRDRKTAFKRRTPYVVPEPTVSEPTEETSTSSRASKKPKKEYEDDPVILQRRQRQIDFGKNTIGYDTYTNKVARKEREKDDPVTPKKHFKYSRRAWDGLIRQWRLRLHNYDP